MILEEESQRITLDGNIDINQFVTGKGLPLISSIPSLLSIGIVVAVHGHENEKGVFIVKDYCFKDLSIPKKLSSIEEDKYKSSLLNCLILILCRFILFASGFLLSETSVIFNQLENLINSLTQPEKIQSKKIQAILSNMVRFVVAGNLIENANRLKDATNQVR